MKELNDYFNKSLNEGKLLATAPTEKRIIKLISDFYFGSTISLKKVNDKEFDVYNKNGLIKSTKVVIKKGKYRFEEK